MKILISAATAKELGPLLSGRNSIRGIEINSLVLGVGMLSATYHLMKVCLSDQIDLIINIGLAGSFKSDLKPGMLVNIQEEMIPELGAENDDAFLDVFQLGLQDANERPFRSGKLYAFKPPVLDSLNHVRSCKGISVNTVHGNESSIEKIVQRCDPDVESMEGAAHFYISTMLGIPCLQVRAISNFVEKRNRDTWKIEEALHNLWPLLENVLDELGMKHNKVG